MNKNNMQPRSNGKFTKAIPIEEKSPEQERIDFILSVKEELFQGYFYLDKIQKAYQLITGIDSPANVRVMRRTIVSFEQ